MNTEKKATFGINMFHVIPNVCPNEGRAFRSSLI